MSYLELLAPAGTLETFGAALDGGADAIYVGAPGFNARNLARDLRLDEIGAMIDHCHSLGKKLYIAANSLILEEELPQVIEKLALLQELGPDALIVQDLGLIHLVREHFPDLVLHGSTLTTVHNSDGVRFQAGLGCERVVLARELTLKEIATIAERRGKTELEIFIHGAMCFSYSGLCLFSSYLGGKSGLRGRCVQPCRRAYTSGSKGSGGKGGKGGKGGRGNKAEGSGNKKFQKSGDSGRYLFSMNDLNGLEVVPFFKEMGISSLKIEGRLRSAHYVHSIVAAYRTVIDASPETEEAALVKAKELADQAMSRKTSSGYFFSPQPAEAISPQHSGNMGIHLGRFSVTRQVGDQLTCKFVTKGSLNRGDRLRLHLEPSGERTAFKLKSLFVLGQQEETAPLGSKVSIELPEGFQLGGEHHVDVYKVDGAARQGGFRPGDVQPEKVGKMLAARKKQLAASIEQLTTLTCDTSVEEQPLPDAQKELKKKFQEPGRRTRPPKSRQERKKMPMEWWLKTDTVKPLPSELPFNPDRYLISINKQTVMQAGKLKKSMGKRARSVAWALPPLIMENDLPRYYKQVQLLLRTGFRSFQLGHISQSLLFKGEKAHLFTDYTVNLVNSQAMAMVSELGIIGGQAGIESDKSTLQQLLKGCRWRGGMVGGDRKGGRPRHARLPIDIPVGMTVYGAPALYTSRLASDHFQYERQLLSPRNEPYIIRKMEGFTQTFPERPFSLLPYLEELKEMGLKYVVVDISGGSSRRELEELKERLHNTGRYGKLSTFNYLGTLY